MEVLEGSYEEITIEPRHEDEEGITRERWRAKSGLSKKTNSQRRTGTWLKRKATPKFYVKYAVHKMRIF